MIIHIPFNEWSMERLSAGKKYATTRNQKYGVPGDIFEAGLFLYRLVSVQRMPLIVVSYHLFEIEGADTPFEFIELWNSIHPRKKYDPDQMVYVHFFVPWGEEP